MTKLLTAVVLLGSAPGFYAGGRASAATINVPAGGDFQGALYSANPGDTIVLQAGATYSGNFSLPTKSGTGYITIQSSALSSLPADGTRVSPSDAGNMPKLVSPNVMAVLQADPGASYYRLVGIEIAAVGGNASQGVVGLGDINATTTAPLPKFIEFYRCYVHGDANLGTHFGIFLNAMNIIVKDSYISDIMNNSQDAQAIGACNTPGPIQITNNFLEATGENVMLGGCYSGIPSVVPSDVSITQNYFYKPPSWQGQNWVVKNSLELKNARRVNVVGNVFENNWVAGQAGFIIVFTPRADNHDANGLPYGILEDITFQSNQVLNSPNGISISGQDGSKPSGTSYSKNITIRNNLLTNVGGNLIQVSTTSSSTPQNLVIDHNTAFPTNTMFWPDNPVQGVVLTNNNFTSGVYGIFGSGLSPGTLTISTNMPGSTIAGNIFIGAPPSLYPAGNSFPPTTSAVGFVDYSGGNYALASGSPYKGTATDGTDPGVDFTALNAALNGAGAPPPPPPAPSCTYALSAVSTSIGTSGSSGSFSVTAPAGCTWTAASNSSWLTITSPAYGTGNGTVTWTAAANSAAARSGTITAAGLSYTVIQASSGTPDPSCPYILNTTYASVPASGGSGSVLVSTNGGCNWMATSNAPWLTVTSGASGNGSGTVSWSAAPNSGGAQTATLTIAGQTYTVSQGGGGSQPPPSPSCGYVLNSTSATVAASGGTGSVLVSASGGCNWTATSNASWLTITSGASGSGSATVSWSAAPNSGAAQIGTLTIAGQTYTVSQSGNSQPAPAPTPSCPYVLSATAGNVAASGGSGSFWVSTNGGCTWTAASNVSWLTIVSGTSGWGSGQVFWSAAPNSGAPQTAAITVAGQTYTVSQAGTVQAVPAPAPYCPYVMSATAATVAAGGGSGSFWVSTNGGCNWTASSNASWLTITSATAFSGSGQIFWTAAPNNGGAQTATITVAGQTYTVSQVASALPAPPPPSPSCPYILSAISASAAAGGSSGSFWVSSNGGCNWTASSSAGWLAITSGFSGSGSGQVYWTAAPNSGAPRIATLIAAGQAYTVSQAGYVESASCPYVLSATSGTATSSGSSGSLWLSTNGGCAWNISSDSPWLTVNTAPSGSGTVNVGWYAASNPGGSRTGTLWIAGQPYTVAQSGVF